MTLFVDKPDHARSLTYGKSQLSEILVVRILNSSDYFISIDAQWLPNIFGLDLTFLCLLKNPIRGYSLPELSVYEGQIQATGGRFSRIFVPEQSSSTSASTIDNSLDPSARYSIPKPVWILIDFLYKMGDPIDVEFTIHNGVYQYICECLCHGVDISTEIFEADQIVTSIDSFNVATTPYIPKNQEIIVFEARVKSWGIKRSTALTCGLQVLYDFLNEIPEPIIPFSLYNRVISEGYQSLSLAKSVLYQIPTLNYNLFIYISSFFKHWLQKDKKGTIKANLSKFIFLISS